MTDFNVKFVLKMLFVIPAMQTSNLAEKNLFQDFILLSRLYQPPNRLKSLIKKICWSGVKWACWSFCHAYDFLLIMAIDPANKVQIALLIAKKVQILAKYLDFSDIFLKKKALILLLATDLN